MIPTSYCRHGSPASRCRSISIELRLRRSWSGAIHRSG